MKGKIDVSVSNGNVKYEFQLRRNLTIIRGDSATGKTTLIELIREYDEAGFQSGVELRCEKECRVLEGRDWKILLQSMRDSIVFIDEENGFVRTNEFAEEVQKTGLYFVIVTRAYLPNLPYSVEEIYGIRTSGKYAGLRQIYHEFYRIYPSSAFEGRCFEPDLIIVEDSNAGYEFFHSLTDRRPFQVISAHGKANILRTIQDQAGENILVIADGAAFGAEMERMMEHAKWCGKIAIYLPESFEWLVLCSGVVQGGNLKNILEEPSEYIESSEYFSWERYFTSLLVELTKGTWLQYTKRKLNPAYINTAVQQKILGQVQKVQLL